ncbi:GFA family protein [Xanthobacter agilis]|jgi:hypothetical protein|uniref:CENP-V/GFA domain-containing protein n=1 Tax=Xanthobacter agilis TaxID=47492 RepID=A0ABU0LBC6_XANAG|nr:GFA family protein [Xanthobacter agilis]MDQ0504445.1 hypothetical protein [Xanthobacter agilis]
MHTSDTPAPLEGGCLCGALRYRLRRVQSAYWCHCSMCQRISGSSALPWATVARGDFDVTHGALTTYASSAGVQRGFCGSCGSPILFDMASEAAVDVTIGTLDLPDRLTPTHHIWTTTALAMSDGLGPGLPRHAAEAPADPA